MNKESENQQDIERFVDQLKIRKKNANGNILSTHSQVEQVSSGVKNENRGIRTIQDDNS